MRLLGLFAHPDDETFCAGGSFARYASQGAEIMVISATRGQAGQIRDARVATRQTLGEVREQELRDACAQLGVRHARCLDYLDGALAEVDPNNLVADFTQAIADFRPTTIITFGPDGGYGHPDHVAVSQAATRAREPSAHPAPRLYYARFPRHRRRLLDRMARWLMTHDERFQGDAEFTRALLHISEEARDLGTIADHIETRWFPVGTSIIEQGEAPATLYLILSGNADAVRQHRDGSLEVLGPLRAGQFFGEIGIALRQPRNAHVIARSDVTCLLFSPAPPEPFLGRGEGAHLAGTIANGDRDVDDLSDVSARIDVSAVIDRKIAAIAAYRSQFAFQPDLIPHALLVDLFGVEYFAEARPPGSLATELG